MAHKIRNIAITPLLMAASRQTRWKAALADRELGAWAEYHKNIETSLNIYTEYIHVSISRSHL
jgi:hypothetical protein